MILRKKLLYALIISLFGILNVKSQKENYTHSIFRINFINPALEYEIPTSNISVLSGAVGVGYGGSYKELEVNSADGFVYVISPFVDLQHKWIYNFDKRKSAGKSTLYNSGNFISIRAIARGSSISENVTRTDNGDFAIGPTWGIQRHFNRFHLLVDFGPQYYFDTLGNSGFFPLMVQVNFGLNLSKMAN